MARIRSIKPEFAKSEAIAALPRDVRLHFALLWTYADDDGRGIDNPKLIKAELWPLDDDVDAAQVEQWQKVLAAHGRIVRYEISGKRYFQVVNFTEHQKPQKKTDSKLPPIPLQEESRSSTREVSPVVVDVDGAVDGEGDGVLPVEQRGTLALVSETVSATPTDPVVVVFDAWKQSTGKARAVLDQKRRRIIGTALKTFPLEDCCDAVRGWQHSPHHRGENDRHTVYNDIDLLLRDAKRIETFRDLQRGDDHRPGASELLRNRAAELERAINS